MTSFQSVTVGEAITKILLAENVETIFGLPGTHVFAIYDALLESSIRHVSVLHEATATQMADMYGRLTGKPGVCLVTGGPGATNTLTALAQAYDATSPVVQISGSVPRNAPREVFHGVDRPDFLMRTFRDVTKWSARIDSVENVGAVLQRAFFEACSGRPGPVAIEVPLDVLKLPRTPMPPYIPRAIRPKTLTSKNLEKITRGLLSSRRPVIVAGKGVLRDGAGGKLATLAKVLQAPVVATRDALGVIPSNNPWYAGYLCFWSTDPWVESILSSADTVLVAGLRAESAFWRQIETISRSSNKYFVGSDVKFQKLAGTLIANNGHLGEGLSALLDSVERRPKRASQWKVKVVEKGRQTVLGYLTDQAKRGSQRPRGRIHQGWAINKIMKTLSRDGILVCDVCHASYWAWKLSPSSHPNYFQHSGVWSGMGFSLPGAASAKYCHPELPVVAIIGDGSLWMSLSDFPTLVRYNLGVVLIVMNDAHFGMVHQFQLKDFGRTSEDKTPVQDFAALAETMGGLGFRAEYPRQLMPALQQALSSGRPCILDVKTAHNDPYPNWVGLRDRLPKLRINR